MRHWRNNRSEIPKQTNKNYKILEWFEWCEWCAKQIPVGLKFVIIFCAPPVLAYLRGIGLTMSHVRGKIEHVVDTNKDGVITDG